MGELFETLIQPLASIGLVEEPGIGEARVGHERISVCGIAVRIVVVVENREK